MRIVSERIYSVCTLVQFYRLILFLDEPSFCNRLGEIHELLVYINKKQHELDVPANDSI